MAEGGWYVYIVLGLGQDKTCLKKIWVLHVQEEVDSLGEIFGDDCITIGACGRDDLLRHWRDIFTTP